MISKLVRNQAFVKDDGTLTERALKWTQNVSNLQTLSGSGSPEGIIEAQQLILYMDIIGTTGNILYIKRDPDIAGDSKKGWVLV